jgi:outer membrane protein assembly factor BamB
VPAEFGPQKNLIWRVDFPPGHSSPVLGAGRIFATGVENERLYTYCLDSRTGRMLWRREAPRPRKEKLHPLNHPASPTPVNDGENVYVFFPDYGLLSYDMEGKPRWTLPLGPFDNVYGVGVSPVLADDKVILVIDQNRDSFILAADRNTGRIVWRQPRREALSGSATPTVLARPGSGSLILAPSSFRMDVYSASTGEPVWWVRGLPSEMKSVAVVEGDTVYISGFNTPENDPGRQIALPIWKELTERSDANKNGFIDKSEAPDERTRKYWMFLDLNADDKLDEAEWNLHVNVMAAQNGLYAFRLGTKGDGTANLKWKYQRSVPQLPSVVVYRGIVYMINDRGVLTTIDARTGEAYKQARLRGVSGDYYASPVAADGKLFFASHNGVVAVLKAGPGQELLAENNLNEDIFATPAVANGRIYIRTVSSIYCFGAD